MDYSKIVSSIATLKCWIKTNKAILTLLLILALAGFLRIYHLGTENLWCDEAFTEKVSSGSFASAIVRGEQPPYFAIVQPWVSLFGNSEASLRAPSAILGIMCILLVYLIGHTFFNQKIGLISSLLSAISLFYIRYSQEARSYALILFLVLLSYLFFILILKKDKNWHYLCYLLANFLLVYTNPMNLSIVAAQILYLLLLWPKYRLQRFKLIILQLAMMLTVHPMVLLFKQRLTGGIPHSSVSLSTPYNLLYLFAGKENLLLAIFIFLAIIAPLSIRKSEAGLSFRNSSVFLKSVIHSVSLQSLDEFLLLLLWLIIPVIFLCAASKIITPMYFNRYLIGASPAFLLLAAKGLSKLKISVYPVLLIIVLVATPNLVDYYSHPQKPEWRETSQFIQLYAHEEDVYIFYPGFRWKSFRYYDQDTSASSQSTTRMPGAKTSTEDISSLVNKVASGRQRLWLVLYSGEGFNPPVKAYLMDVYGSDSVVLQKEFHNIQVLLFDLTQDSNGN